MGKSLPSDAMSSTLDPLRHGGSDFVRYAPTDAPDAAFVRVTAE